MMICLCYDEVGEKNKPILLVLQWMSGKGNSQRATSANTVWLKIKSGLKSVEFQQNNFEVIH